MLSAVEGEAGLGAMREFKGLGAVCNNGVLAFSGAELAEACAKVATQIDQANEKLLAECDRRLIAASRKDGAARRMTTWVREHADELAAVWARP